MSDSSSDVTTILQAIREGDTDASDALLPLVYDELRRLARAKMAREPAGHTLQPTALVHEALLRLVQDEKVRWNGRGHFFGAAAEAMRRILIERARRKGRIKHGGNHRREALGDVSSPEDDPLDVLALDEAIDRLAAIDERKARIVKLRFFAGLSVEETAGALDLSASTVKSDWSYARAWLYRELQSSDPITD